MTNFSPLLSGTRNVMGIPLTSLNDTHKENSLPLNPLEDADRNYRKSFQV